VSTLRQRSVVVSPLLLGLFGCVSACAPATPVDRATELRQGAMLYATNGCAACHGPEGHGNGPVAKTLKPPPRDFRDQSAFKNGRDPDSVAKTLATGLTRDGGQMQSYAHLSDRERDLLARFVISLGDVSSTGGEHDAKPQ
jgi:high-affinity iron transporter